MVSWGTIKRKKSGNSKTETQKKKERILESLRTAIQGIIRLSDEEVVKYMQEKVNALEKMEKRMCLIVSGE